MLFIEILSIVILCLCALSRNGGLLAPVQFEKNDLKTFAFEQPFTYYILVGVHNLPFLLRVHTCNRLYAHVQVQAVTLVRV